MPLSAIASQFSLRHNSPHSICSASHGIASLCTRIILSPPAQFIRYITFSHAGSRNTGARLRFYPDTHVCGSDLFLRVTCTYAKKERLLLLLFRVSFFPTCWLDRDIMEYLVCVKFRITLLLVLVLD